MSKHPWTDGPWIPYNGGVWWSEHGDPEISGAPIASVYQPTGISGGGGWGPQAVFYNKADAELTALAPEMAAAILRFAKWANKQPGLDPQEEELELLAEKILKIGDTSEQLL